MKLNSYHPFKSAQAQAKYHAHYDKLMQWWPVESESRVVDTAYGQTYIRICGPENAPPLALLPGASASSPMWYPNIGVFAEHFRTYSIDNIYDFGRSIYTRYIKSIDDYMSWLDELFTKLGFDSNLNLLGMSLGGCLSFQCARRFPERFSKMVLLAPVMTIFPISFSFMVRGILSLFHRRFVESLVTWLLEDFSKNPVNRPMVEAFINDMHMSNRWFKLKPMGGFPKPPTDEELGGLRVPTMILVGENEKFYSAAKARERLKQAAPQIDYRIIPEAGHDLTFVKPEAVNKAVVEFLRDK